MKWSKIRPRAQKLMDECLSAWADKESIMASPDRWADPLLPPEAKQLLLSGLGYHDGEELQHDADLDESGNALTKKVLTAADIWAAAMNAQWFKTCENLIQLLRAQDVQFAHVAFHIGSSLEENDSCLFDRVLAYLWGVQLQNLTFQVVVSS